VCIFLLGFKEEAKWLSLKYFDSNFYSSFTASFIEDVIFFGVIGLSVFIYSVKRPENDPFESRIKFLANSQNLDGSAIKYLSDQARATLAYSDVTQIRIYLRSYNPETSSITVSCSIESSIRNMCKDVEFDMTDTKLKIDAGVIVHGNYGLISHASIADENDPDHRSILVHDKIYYLENKKYEDEFKYTIRPNGKAIRSICFQIYYRINGDRKDEESWFYINAERFTQNFNVEVVNEMGEELNFWLDYDFPDPLNKKKIEKKEQLLQQTQKICDSVTLNKNDAVKLYIYKSLEK
tara:strand:- start:362 stop:1243 length:882 start_codon:yes stop_codon:yes gene_type:complete